MQKHVNLLNLVKSFPTNIYFQNLASIQPRTSPIKFAHLAEKPEAMYTESAFRREELEGSGGEKQPEEGMESAEILRNICEKDVTLFRTAHSKDLNSVSWALRTLVEREPETFFRYL